MRQLRCANSLFFNALHPEFSRAGVLSSAPPTSRANRSAFLALLTCIGLGWQSGAIAGEVPGRADELRASGADTVARWKEQLAQADAARSVADPADSLEEVTVFAFRRRNPATKTEVRLLDVPQSVQVVDQTLIRAKGDTRLTEALQNVSGIAVQSGQGRYDDFTIRGFPATFDIFRDGVRDDILEQFRSLANIERVEVLKGPSAALYGRGSLGGIINLITKKPTTVPTFTLETTAGSYGVSRSTVDLGGALGSPQFAYRLVGAYEVTNSFRDFGRSERTVVAPSIAWQPSKETNVLLQLEFKKDNRVIDRGVPGYGSGPLGVPINFFYGEPFDVVENQILNGGLTVEHRFSGEWSVRNVSRIIKGDAAWINTTPRGGPLQPGQNLLQRNIFRVSRPQENYFNQTEITYKTALGSVENTLLIGLEFGKQQRDLVLAGPNSLVYPALAVDVFNPTYLSLGQLPAGAYAELFGPPTTDTTFEGRTLGIYLQNQFKFSDQWRLLVGGRFDNFVQRQTDRLTGQRLERLDNVFSPRVGIVYQPAQQSAVYFNFSQSFVPQGNQLTSLATNNIGLGPQSATLFDLGTKNDFFGGGLSTTLSFYQIDLGNVPAADPLNPSLLKSTGELRSRGIELDVTGRITPQWQLFGNFSINDAQYVQSTDPTFLPGNRLASVPPTSGSLWTTYTFDNGLGIGGGLVYAGERYAYGDNLVLMPSYVRADATVFYQAERYRVQLNLRNLFDTRYYESSTGENNNTIFPGAPFSFLLSVRVDLGEQPFESSAK